MQYTEFIHPEDAAALKALKAIPLLSKVLKKAMDIGAEQLQTGMNMATKIRLSPTQLPHLYNILPPICEQLEIREPEYFLEMSPLPNAYAFGDTQTAITITSALVEMMSEEELRAVVAHECGHIACHHMLYHTLAQMIANASGAFEALAALAIPVQVALFYWQRKSELSTRLEEVNTACQVVAGRVERVQTRIDKERKRYSRIYEQTDKDITITDWLREWRESHEGLKGRIQQMAAAWNTVNKQIEDESQEQRTEQALLEELALRQAAVSQWADTLQKRIEACRTQADEYATGIERLAGSGDPRTPFRESYKQFLQAIAEESEVAQEAELVQSQASRARGKSDFRTQLEHSQAEMLAEGRAEVDVWIHNFNAQNSPIQYAELERMMQDDRDWHELRTRIQSSTLETALCQERVDNLNSRIVCLQAEGGKASGDEEEMLASLASQQETLEQQRRDIMLQIARADITLESQEHSTAQSAG